MGVCCSCLKSGSSQTSETELTNQNNLNNSTSAGNDSPKKSPIFISAKMSAPSIKMTEQDLKVEGTGLALANLPIEQDAAYWEWHVETSSSSTDSDDDDDVDFDAFSSLKFGVATRKNREFYNALQSNQDGDDTELDDGTALMKPIVGLEDGDVIGVAVQQSDLPMVQFLLNGEPQHEIAINRFRGTVYPSVSVVEGFKVKAVFDEDSFKELSPHVRFGPLIAARGII